MNLAMPVEGQNDITSNDVFDVSDPRWLCHLGSRDHTVVDQHSVGKEALRLLDLNVVGRLGDAVVVTNHSLPPRIRSVAGTAEDLLADVDGRDPLPHRQRWPINENRMLSGALDGPSAFGTETDQRLGIVLLQSKDFPKAELTIPNGEHLTESWDNPGKLQVRRITVRSFDLNESAARKALVHHHDVHVEIADLLPVENAASVSVARGDDDGHSVHRVLVVNCPIVVDRFL